jgi:7,8-dihydro-6-hydroxymethylpterin dimethyltransferase
MVMTGDGPISMCMHNAKRDDFILKPVEVQGKAGVVWDPLTGRERPAQAHLKEVQS